MVTVRENILRRLMHQPVMGFNELWAKQGASNKFAYHLKVLEEDELIEKKDSGYSLTHKGRKYAAYAEGNSGKVLKPPLVGVIIAVVDEKNDKVLMMKRSKEPFYGYWGFHGGKLKFSQYILECAREEIEEEAGLTCDLELKGLFSSKTYNDKNLAYNHQLFVVKATNPRGELIEKTREGENRWFSREEVKSLKIFPNIPQSIEIVFGKGFRWVEADRFQENDSFSGIDVVTNRIL